MKRLSRPTVFLIAGLVIGCANITINVYFPAESVQKAADVIEDRVRGQVLEEPVAPPAEPQESTQALRQGFLLNLLCPPAYAAEADLNINTPEIMKYADSRAARFPEVDDLLTRGAVGEGKDGYLKERDLKALGDLKKIAAARKAIQDENADRLALYKAIAKANEIAEDKVAEIGENFALRIREKLRDGQFFQNDKGEWEQKKPEKEKK